MKRIIGISVFIMLIFITAGCYKSYEEYKPKDIANWDGNYIYYENKVSKTTGEDEMVLFDSFTYNDITYSDFYISDHVFIENNIYLCVKSSDEEKYFILEYIIYEDKLNVVFVSEKDSLSKILKHSSNYLIVSGAALYKVSLDNYEVSFIDSCDEYEVYDEYIIYENDNDELFIYNYDTNEINYICMRDKSFSLEYEFINVCEREVILIKKCEGPSYESDSKYNIVGLEIYDIESKTYSVLVNAENGKTVYRISNEYFLIGNMSVKHLREDNKIHYDPFMTNNSLYKINYNNKFEVNLLYEFEDKYDCTQSYIDGDYIRIKMRYLKDSKHIEGYDVKKKIRKYSIKDNKLKFAITYKPLDNVGNGSEEDSYKVIFNNCTYIFKKEYYSQYVRIDYSYYLYKKTNDSEVILQFYCTHGDYSDEEYITSSFLEGCATEKDLDRIKILDYVKENEE